MEKGLNIFSLNGKTALITGGTGHLGRSMAFILAEAGARVYVNSRSHGKNSNLVSEIRMNGHAAESAVFDVTSVYDVEKFAESLGGGALDILVNNAYLGGGGTIELTSEEAYTASYNISVISAHRLLRILLPNLKHAVKMNGDASVINLASMYALVSPDQRIYDNQAACNPPFYGAAKAALIQWTRYAACEYGKEGVRVNSVSPGPFPNDEVQVSNFEFIERLSKKIPLNRVGATDEIRGPILFLASPASSFVSGANIVVDGGWTCW